MAIAVGIFASGEALAQEQPVAPVRPVATDYYGTKVVDNYRYMENLGDAEVREWTKLQAQYTRSVLDAIPGRPALLNRIHTLLNADISRRGFVRRGQRYFYQVFEPGAQQAKLYYRDGLDGKEHLLLDPAALGRGAGTRYAVDYFEPSWDGQLMAYGISTGGSEESVLHVMEVSTGIVRSEAIERTSDSVVAWLADNRSFFYLRYSKPVPGAPAAQSQYNARTYRHVVGTQADGEGDPAVFGRGVSEEVDVPEGQGTYIVLAPGSPYAVAVANHNMDQSPSTIYVAPLSKVLDSHTPWLKVADVADGVTQIELHGELLYFLSQKGAPRFRLLTTPLARPAVQDATVILPEGPGVLTNFSLARDGIYARVRDGAVSTMHRLSFDGKQSHAVPLPFQGNVGAAVTDAGEPGALMSIRGWTQRARVVAYDPASDTAVETALMPRSTTDTSQLESKEVFAVSYDGTRIPLSLIYKKGLKLDGTHPTLLEGYGSYGASMEPGFNPTHLAWIERDAIIAIAHVRGGGEYGEDWHLAGQKLNKTNTILDFIACAQYLVDEHYTSPAKLAGEGRSAGGLTVGGALTWRPDLFAVILDLVGVSDSLRSETEPNGPPNTSEFGSVETQQGFHGLYAMSSYVHVRDGTSYPATLFSTGVNDPRVAPWQMTKMAARVQAATTSKRPVLLRVDFDAGHGMGSSTSQYEAELADLWAFSLWQMGDPAFQPGARP